MDGCLSEIDQSLRMCSLGGAVLQVDSTPLDCVVCVLFLQETLNVCEG